MPSLSGGVRQTKKAPEAESSGFQRRQEDLYEWYELRLYPRQLRLLETADLFCFVCGQALEHFSNTGRRGGLADMNDLGHVLTSMMQLYGEGARGGQGGCHRSM